MRLGMELASELRQHSEHKTDPRLANKKKGDGFWFNCSGLILSEPGTQEYGQAPRCRLGDADQNVE